MTYRTEDEELFSDDEQLEAGSESLESPHFASADGEMRGLLERWKAPEAPGSLDRRVMTAYRREVSAPFWKRALASSIRVPLPAAAAVILALIGLSLLSLRSIRPTSTRAVTNPPPQVRVVEVPVVQEKIVTRTVYVEKGPATKAGLNHRTRNAHLAGVRDNVKPIRQRESEPGRYVTHADLSGFQPVTQMKIEVIRKEGANEN